MSARFLNEHTPVPHMLRKASPCIPPNGLPPAKTYPAGAVLLMQGDSPDDVFVIEQGIVKLRRVQSCGKEAITGIRMAGDFVGAAAAVLGHPNPADAIAITPCRVTRMDFREFLDRLRSDKEFSWRLHEMQSREICGDCDHLAELGCVSAGVRLQRMLLKLASSFGCRRGEREILLKLPLKKWELAQIIGVTPQYLCQLFTELESTGVMARRGSVIALHTGPSETVMGAG
jgi:CRP-like cAMP-binding protein